jgi:hypothetical protein
MASNTFYAYTTQKKVAKKKIKLPIYKPLKIGISNYKKNRPQLLIGKFTKKEIQFIHLYNFFINN